MIRTTLFKEELELDELRETHQQLLLRQQEIAELPKRLEREQRERDCTMPPHQDIADREQRIRHMNCVTRGEVTNVLRDQTRSFALLILLLAATGSLIWWGVKLMQGQ